MPTRKVLRKEKPAYTSQEQWARKKHGKLRTQKHMYWKFISFKNHMWVFMSHINRNCRAIAKWEKLFSYLKYEKFSILSIPWGDSFVLVRFFWQVNPLQYHSSTQVSNPHVSWYSRKENPNMCTHDRQHLATTSPLHLSKKPYFIMAKIYRRGGKGGKVKFR